MNGRQEDVSVRVDACEISVKAGDLSHIVEELVDNACKFSRQETPVNVELRADGKLIITDRGRGLTAEEIGRIGAFQQFDRNKFEQQGLGLGLVLVQKLMAPVQSGVFHEKRARRGIPSADSLPFGESGLRHR